MSVPSGSASDPLPRLYDWEHDLFRDDLDFHLALARRSGDPVLELGCGTGRVLSVLAAAGFQCTGVDASEAMLARARTRLEGLGLVGDLVCQRAEHLSLAGQFRTILWPLDGFALLVQQDDQVAALRAARAHATHDARLVIDVSNGNLRGGNEAADEVVHHLTAPDPQTGRPITKWAARRPHPEDQIDEISFFYDEQAVDGAIHRTIAELRLRWFTRSELQLLLQVAGWSVDEVYGGYDLEPFGAQSERIILVAR